LWDIEDVDRKMNDILKRRDDAEELVKRLKELKKDAKAAPWADMSADLGHGQVETFKAKDFGWKVSKVRVRCCHSANMCHCSVVLLTKQLGY